jgi:hypothetical protein
MSYILHGSVFGRDIAWISRGTIPHTSRADSMSYLLPHPQEEEKTQKIQLKQLTKSIFEAISSTRPLNICH